MRERHEKEIECLQKFCLHMATEIQKFQWAPGHSHGTVEVCLNCGLILRHIEPKPVTFKTTTNG